MLNQLIRKKNVYYEGFKMLCHDPRLFSAMVAESSSWVGRWSVNLIERVKKPLAVHPIADTVEFTKEVCRVRLHQGDKSMASLLHCAEECLTKFLRVNLYFNFNMRVESAEIRLNSSYDYPVDCLFSMGSSCKQEMELELKTKGFAQRIFSVNLLVDGKDIGSVFFSTRVELAKVLPPIK